MTVTLSYRFTHATYEWKVMSKMPFERYRNTWHNIQSSLWFLPTVLGLTAFILSYLLPEIDLRMARQLAAHRGWLFSGSPSAARTLLSVLAGSLITVITVLFSITMLTLQQASSQFTPRVFQNFIDDRWNQWVLGTYIATFLYCILVLRQVRSETAALHDFVPVSAITLALVLAVVCIALLVYYIHHTASLFQAGTIIERVHHDLIGTIDRLYPESHDLTQQPATEELQSFKQRFMAQAEYRIHSEETGYLRSIDEESICRALPGGACAAIRPAVGHYIVANTVLLEATEVMDDERRVQQVRAAFVLDRERTLNQDALFGVRQLVDIAVKALSPSINDPTTAQHAISCLGNALIRLAGRAFPTRIRVHGGEDDQTRVMVWVNRPEFADYVEMSFSQIRRSARDDVEVTWYLLDVLDAVAQNTSDDRAHVIQEQIDRIVAQVNAANFITADRERLLAAAAEAMAATTSIPLQG